MTDPPETGGRWFYVHEGRRKGPINAAQLAELILAQTLPEDVLVWRHGLEEWAPASSLDEIKRDLPPPLPVPATEKPGAPAVAVAAAEEVGEDSGSGAEGPEPGSDGPNGGTAADRKRRRRHRHRQVTRRPRWLIPLIMVLIVVVVLWYLLLRFNQVPAGQIVPLSALAAPAEHRS